MSRVAVSHLTGWLAAAVVAAGCVSPAPSPVVARTAAEPAGPTVEDRVGKLERILASNSLADVLQRLDVLQRDVGKLQGSQEMQSHQLIGAQKQQKDLYLDSDRRLQALESAMSAIAIRVTALEGQMAQLAANANAANDAATIAAAEEQDYQKALDAFKDDKSDQAIPLFQAYLRRHPSGHLRDNAFYWLGESQLAQKDPKGALESFGYIVAQFPDSEKIADAQLKIGYSYYELKDWKKAKDALNTTRKNYPDTTAAKLAEKRLKQIKLEGH